MKDVIYEVGKLGKVTVTSTAQTLADLGITISNRLTEISFLNVGQNVIYVTEDGTDPTTASYELLSQGGSVVKVTKNVASRMKFKTDSGTSDMNVHQH